MSFLPNTNEDLEYVDKVGQYYLKVKGDRSSLEFIVRNSNGHLEISVNAKCINKGLTEVSLDGVTSVAYYCKSEVFLDTFDEAVFNIVTSDILPWISLLKTPEARKYELCAWIGTNVLSHYEDLRKDRTHIGGVFEKVVMGSRAKSKAMPKFVRDLIL